MGVAPDQPRPLNSVHEARPPPLYSLSLSSLLWCKSRRARLPNPSSILRHTHDSLSPKLAIAIPYRPGDLVSIPIAGDPPTSLDLGGALPPLPILGESCPPVVSHRFPLGLTPYHLHGAVGPSRRRRQPSGALNITGTSLTIAASIASPWTAFLS
jgi:hypothetical protein